jgi:hypothetical protein
VPAGPLAEDEREWTASGRVVDDKNVPVPDAQVVAVVCLSGFPEPGEHRLRVLGSTRVDDRGRFRLGVRDRPSGRIAYPVLLALAPGRGLDSTNLGAWGGRQDVVLRLPPEVLLRARFIDLQGAPAAGVRVCLRDAMTEGKGGLGSRFWGADGELPPWPRPLITDADGRLTVRGFGAGQRADLEVCDERFAPRQVALTGGEKAPGGEQTIVLEPSQVITGRVTAADTGKPVAGARVGLVAYHYGPNYISSTETPGGRTDDAGRFRAAGPASQHYAVQVLAPQGQPYLSREERVAWPRGAVRHEVTLSLPRGVVVSGSVVEEGSGKPVAGARIIFHPRGSNSFAVRGNENLLPPGVLSYQHSLVRSAADGSFRITVPEAPGHLLVMGPTPNYVTRPVGNNELWYGKPGGYPRHYHAFLALDARGGKAPREVRLTLRRGVTLRGEVTGPDGKPVEEGIVLGSGLVSPTLHAFPEEHETTSTSHRFHASRFELDGCDPDRTYRLLFLSGEAGVGGLGLRGELDARAGMNWRGDGRGRLGAAVEVKPAQAGGKPLAVRLAPCGSVAGRFLGPDGKPVPVRYDWLNLLVSPGPALQDAVRAGTLAGERVDINGPHDEQGKALPLTDNQGRTRLDGLIPGARYLVDNGGFRREFTAGAGEVVDLGEVRLTER